MHYTETTEHEISVIASLISFPDEIDNRQIKQSDFSNPRALKIFSALESVRQEGMIFPSKEKFVEELGRRSKQTVADLLQVEDWAFDYHLSRLRTSNAQRFVREIAEVSENLNLDEIADKLTGFLAKSPRKTMRESIEVHSAHDNFVKELEKRKEKYAAGGVGIVTGYQKFDNKVCMQEGQLVIMAARPSIGKSALALNLATGAAMYGSKVMYVSLEMSKGELMNRLYAYYSGTHLTKFKYGNVDSATLVTAKKEIENMTGKLWIEYMPGASSIEILAQAELRASTEGLDLLVVDHMDLLSDRGQKGENEATTIGRITAGFKAFAGKQDLTVLSLSQFNRESKGNFPKLHELRGSGAKEQDADSVVILHRELDEDAVDFHKATLRIAKNRSGEVGDMLLHFTPETTSFKES